MAVNGKTLGQRKARMKPERQYEIERLLTQCVPHPQIRRYLSQKWGITEHTVDAYVRETYRRWAALPAMDKDGRREQMRQVLSEFYQRAMRAGNHSAAVTALDRLSKLDGLYAPEKVEVRDSSAEVASTDPDRVRQRIVELYRKHLGVLPEGATTAAPADPDPTTH